MKQSEYSDAVIEMRNILAWLTKYGPYIMIAVLYIRKNARVELTVNDTDRIDRQ